MKKTLKQFLSLIVVVAMILSTFTFVYADGIGTITIKEEVVDATEGIRKLVFSFTAPKGAKGILSTNLLFSYNHEQIQPVRKDTFADVTLSSTSTAAAAERPFKVFENDDYVFKFASIKILTSGVRTAVNVATYSTDAYDATSGMNFTEFYFRIKDGQSTNGDTFKIETEYTDGSCLKTWYPDINDAAAIKIVEDETNYQFCYGDPAAEDTAILDSFKYTGSDILTLDTIEVSGAESVAVPTVYPAQDAAAVEFTANAIATNGASMTLPADIVWSLKSAPEGVAINGMGAKAVLTVAPGTAAGIAEVAVTSGGIDYTAKINVTREALVASKVVLTANGTDTDAFTAVKPATATSLDNTVTFATALYDQYGGAMNDAVTVAKSGNDIAGTTFENNVLTVKYGAGDGSFDVVATYGELSDTVTVTVSGLEVDWSGVSTSAITYGQKVSSAVTLPSSGTTTSPAVYNGTFSVVNGDETPVAGEAKAIVSFKVNDANAGDYNNVEITKEYPITVNKADYNMSGVTVANKTATYNGEAHAVAVDGTAPEGVTYVVTYQAEGGEATQAAPTEAGTYTVTVSFTGDADNYNAIPDKTATLVIEKATSIINIEDVVTYNYDGEEKTVVATLNHNEAELSYSPSQSYTDAGTYTVTVSAEETKNYKAVSKDVTLVINKAAATGFDTVIDDTVLTAREAYDAGITSVSELKNYLALENTAVAKYGSVKTEEVDIDWADATEEWNAKGGTYTFVGTPSSNNLSFADLTLKAKVTITPVTATINPALANITIAESTLADAVSYEDVKLPVAITLELADENITIDNVTWDKSIEDIKGIKVGDSESITIADGVLPEWVTVSAASLVFTVTDKYPVDVKVTQEGSTYGTDLTDPVAEQEAIDDGTDDAATYAYTYKGTTDAGEVYESDVAPTEAGTYTVTATLVSDTHAGTGTSDPFTITPLDVEFVIDNVDKKYKEPNPEFTGTLGTLAYDDTEEDLGITFVCNDATEYPVGQEVEISATSSNKNYNLEVTNGTLSVVKKPLSDEDMPVPTIGGSGKIGEALTASYSGIASSEYGYQWMVGGVEIDGATEISYTPIIADSNKEITVKVVSKEINYSDASAASEAKLIDKYMISGTLSADIVNGGAEDSLDIGDTITVNTSAIKDIEALTAAGAEFVYEWTLDGTPVEGQTATSITLVEGMTGVLAVNVTVAGDFDGSLSLTVGEIGKVTLTGSIVITLVDGAITYVTELPGEAGVDYNLTWYRGETEVEVEGDVYTVTPDDYGKTITFKAVAAGDVYTGEITSNAIDVPAIAPSDVKITTTSAANKITVKLTANENGAAISSYDVTITDGADYSEAVTVTPVDGNFTYTFTGLTNGTQYTITAIANNAMGSSEAAEVKATPKKSSPSGGGGGGGAATYTVRFNTNGGSVVSSISVAKNKAVSKPADPTKDGYTFAGWYTDAELTKAYDFAELVTTGFTLYAKWNAVATDEPADEPVVDTNKLPFIDVADNAWYKDVVKYVYDNKLMNGVASDAFEPDAEITRAMFVTVLYRMAGEPAAADSIFTDIENGSWYANAVAWANANGIVNGVSDTEFAPNENITREQMAAIAYRYANFKGYDMTSDAEISYSDSVVISDYAMDAVLWAASQGIMNGNANGTFAPVNNSTRAEAAAVFMRIIENLK